MRLYGKLALLLLVTCMTQVTLHTHVVGDTYFAMRCYIATVTGDRAMESRLVSECERSFAIERGHLPSSAVVIASR